MKRINRILNLLVLISVLGYGIFIYFNQDMYFCPILKYFHIYCPACGITRMFLSVLNLEFYQAYISSVLPNDKLHLRLNRNLRTLPHPLLTYQSHHENLHVSFLSLTTPLSHLSVILIPHPQFSCIAIATGDDLQ